MTKRLFAVSILFSVLTQLGAQPVNILNFFPDSIFNSASVSLTVADMVTGEVLFSIDPSKTVMPASVQKLVTSSAALEILGPDYRFTTVIGYTGQLNKSSGTLTGDIIIRGGGDPVLGSEKFADHYGVILDTIISAIQLGGIKKIKGRIIVDDRNYDFNPVPASWSWEDMGNYYGAGAYGLSVFDNTYRIFFSTGAAGSIPVITKVYPEVKELKITNYLTSEGKSDQGYVYSAPYGSIAWITGTIPENREEFALKASIPDPPLMLATILKDSLIGQGVNVSGEAVTARAVNDFTDTAYYPVYEIASPPLSEIIDLLNHESINLIAEHLLKQIGYESTGTGTNEAGIESINAFLDSAGLKAPGIFIADGSGLSPFNGTHSAFITSLIRYMVNESSNALIFRSSLPRAGENGTMKTYFRDPVFVNNLQAKTGTLTRVKSFAGTFKGMSGREFAFCIIMNNYNGSTSVAIKNVEEMMKYIIINY